MSSELDTANASSEAQDTPERMIDLNWSTNWSELPAEAEQKVEEAYILLSDAYEVAEQEEA